MRLLLCIMAVAVAGCATPEQQAARRQAEAQYREQQEIAYTRSLAAQCDGLGFQRGTDPWRNCMLQLHGQNQAANAALRSVIIQQYLQQQQRPAYQAPRPRQPTQTNCTRDAWGNLNCYTY